MVKQRSALKIDEHGEAVMNLLNEYAVLRGGQLRRTVFAGRSEATQRRLGYTLMADLLQGGVVERVYLPSEEAVYLLGVQGRDELSKRGQKVSDPKLTAVRNSVLLHRLAINELVLAVQLDCRRRGVDSSWHLSKGAGGEAYPIGQLAVMRSASPVSYWHAAVEPIFYQQVEFRNRVLAHMKASEAESNTSCPNLLLVTPAADFEQLLDWLDNAVYSYPAARSTWVARLEAVRAAAQTGRNPLQAPLWREAMWTEPEEVSLLWWQPT